ncbi:dihydrodipicolinate synthase family protein [Marinovum sp.]|uniref:dihydrodipicolinate synthase family protein n=1 Tax=Marinovum sp. TaxID=2024839 RepID=UPI002B26BFCA|nr:dihydrodipicolinate synthase family protein [Marinovum sp.]
MSDRAELTGIVCAAATPVDDRYRIEVARLAQHCARVLDAGCAFVSVFGTTGEGASFASAEKIEALSGLVAAGVPAGRQIPAIMTPVLTEAAEMLAATEGLGCRAALVLPPFYYDGVGNAGVVAFFEALLARAGSTEIDLLLYNIPRFSRIAYTPELVALLIERFGDRIVGVKDSTGDLQSGLALVKTFPQLAVFTGDDRVMPPLRQQGGAGMIGGMPNLFAADAVRILAAPEAGGTEALRAASARRIETVDGHGGLPVLKAMLARHYGHPGWARAVPPLAALPEAAEARVLAAFAETGYIPGDST